MKSIKSKTDLITESVKKNITPFIDQEKKISILISFSAGPDSTVLLDILNNLRKNMNIDIFCAYYNHKLRAIEEIEREIRTASDLCIERGVELIIGEADKTDIAKKASQTGVEAAARLSRYCFLNKETENRNFDYIAVAHNYDDNIETIIMRFFTGSSSEGLKGIPEKNGKIIRPLINTEKKEILNYLKEKQITCSQDTSNYSDKYLRNRLRLHLIPVLKDIFPGFDKSLIDFSEKMLFTDNFITEETLRRIQWINDESGYKTDYDVFSHLPECIKMKSLYNLFNAECKSNSPRLPYRFIKPVLTHSIDNKSSLLLKGHGFRLERFRKHLFWKSDIVIKNKNSYLLDMEEGKHYRLNNLPDTYGKIYLYYENAEKNICKKEDIWILPEKIEGKLQIRSRRDGDTVKLAEGSKKVKKIFQESGIINNLRNYIPLICDDSGIIAVWGSVFGYKNRIAARIIDLNNKNRSVIIFRMRQE